VRFKVGALLGVEVSIAETNAMVLAVHRNVKGVLLVGTVKNSSL